MSNTDTPDHDPTDIDGTQWSKLTEIHANPRRLYRMYKRLAGQRTAMLRHHRWVLFALLAGALLVGCLTGPAVAVADEAGAAEPITRPAQLSGSANETVDATNETLPGSTLAGALGSEQATLDGEFRSQSYELRLRRADTPAERRAVLRAIEANLSEQYTGVVTRSQRLDSGDYAPGKQAYRAASLRTETAVISRIAASSERIARNVTDSGSLPAQFGELTTRSASAALPAGTDEIAAFRTGRKEDSVGIADWDRSAVTGTEIADDRVTADLPDGDSLRTETQDDDPVADGDERTDVSEREQRSENRTVDWQTNKTDIGQNNDETDIRLDSGETDIGQRDGEIDTETRARTNDTHDGSLDSDPIEEGSVDGTTP